MAGQRRSINDLGELQRAVMEIVWEQGQASVAQVRECVNRDRSKELAYTTILTVLQKLESSGWLTHHAEGRTYFYQAQQSREDAGAASVKTFVNRVFGGDPLSLFQHLLKGRELSDEELTTLRKMIDRHRKERRK